MRAKIHATAIVSPKATIGAGTRIWHWSHIREGATIGDDCVLGQNVYVAPTAVIGRGVKIQNNVSIYDGVILEDDVFCGPSAVFTNVRTPRSHVDRSGAFEKTLIKKGATIGANATVICGVTIGEYAMIGAGAVITKNIAPYARVLGSPARQIGWSCRCGTSLPTDLPLSPGPEPIDTSCPECGEKYRLKAGSLHFMTT